MSKNKVLNIGCVNPHVHMCFTFLMSLLLFNFVVVFYTCNSTELFLLKIAGNALNFQMWHLGL